MTPLRAIFKPSTAPQYRKIVDRLLPKLHGHSRTTLSLIAGAVAEVKRSVLSEWARELPLPIYFKHKLKRVWRFFAKSRFKVESTSTAISSWLLASLKDREFLEVVLDWTKVRQHWVLSLSVPYRKRAIPALWRATDFEDDDSMNQIERRCVREFLRLVPTEQRTRVIFVADRGFGKAAFFVFLKKLGARFVVRMQKKVWIEARSYRGWLGRFPLTRKEIRWLPQVRAQQKIRVLVNLVLKHEPVDSVYLATNLESCDTALEIYRRRMTIEEGFRDFKDGMQLKILWVNHPRKVEKVFLVLVVVYIAMMLVGTAFEGSKEWINMFSIAKVKPGRCKLLSTFRLGGYIIKKLPITMLDPILLKGKLRG